MLDYARYYNTRIIQNRLRRLVGERSTKGRPCSSTLSRAEWSLPGRPRARWSCSRGEEGRIGNVTLRWPRTRTTHAGERVGSRSMIDSLTATCSKTAPWLSNWLTFTRRPTFRRTLNRGWIPTVMTSDITVCEVRAIQSSRKVIKKTETIEL